MAGEVARLAKPQMRGMLQGALKKHLLLAALASTFTTSIAYFTIFRSHKIAYKEFYENYDPDKDYQRMKKAGIFKCFDA